MDTAIIAVVAARFDPGTERVDGPEAAVRVGINTRLLSAKPGYRQTGVARYIERLSTALPAAMEAEDNLVLLGQPAPANERPAHRAIWEQTALPRVVRRHGLDLLHGPVNVLPVAARCAMVVTIHDLAFLRLPDVVPPARRRYLAAMITMAVRRASRILTVSEHTKVDVVDLLGVGPDRVIVTPLGVDSRFRPIPREAKTAFFASLGLERPFILAVGTLEPRKNLPALLRAFGQIASQTDHDLVLAGPDGWLNAEIDRTFLDLPERVRERVRFAGFVADDDLPAWYSAASVMVYPSLYEGFGLPVLESMACGTPVVTSNRSSLPEIVGQAALTGDPTDVDWLGAAIIRILSDAKLAASLARAGQERARCFTWERTARLTADSYRQALEDR